MNGPLSGLRVVDVTQSAAGPFCTMILADLGADVIKVEKPVGGDDARSWSPPAWGDYGCTFLALNRNKRSIALDLRSPAGKEIFTELIGTADVLAHNLRSGALDALGFGWEAARRINPRLIYLSMTAFGDTGPLARLPGYDPLIQAFAGLMSLTGERPEPGAPPRPPIRVGTSINDMGTGLWGAIAVLSALMNRERTGEGQLVQTSLLETAVAWIPYQIMAYLGTGQVPGPHGSGTSMNAPYEAFPTSDGYVMVAAGNDVLWSKMCHAIGRTDLLDDPRFEGNPNRVRNRFALVEALSETFRTAPPAHWVSLLQEAGVPCAPIRTVDEVVVDPQVEHLRMLRAVEHQEIDGYQDVALPIQWDGQRAPTRSVPPTFGGHTREILRALGHPEERIAALLADGVVAETKEE
ncbi:CaiB/BaiF CoA transferase family protein [Jiangella asiatica]|uniref:CoA transferase n=1 Tax=Jiangella asiatica TaxID=2530372 RepID=A0A4R5DDB5_9ACTN|nr:CoA transferase [Jiangella asiatica]TDE11812.1 CoA transferase [Jiangella asiatica]